MEKIRELDGRNLTYISLDILRNLGNLRLIRHITLVERHAPGLAIVHLLDIQHGHSSTAHAIHLSNQQTQPAGTARDDNDLIAEVDFARQTVSDPVVDGYEDPAEGDYGSPRDGHQHWWRVPEHILSPEAEGDNPGDKGVEEARLEDLDEEVDG